MSELTSVQLKALNFSATFEQMCNFIAVSKVGDPKATISGLVQLCLLEFPNDSFTTTNHFCSTIETVFGIAIPEREIQIVLDDLETKNLLSRPAQTNYALSPIVQAELQARIDDATKLQKRVKDKWFEELEVSRAPLPREKAWRALESYLFKTFRRHGIQAAALLDPTIETSPEYESSLSSILRNAIKNNVSQEFHEEAKKNISGFLAQVGADTDRTRYIAQLADGAFNFYALGVPSDLANQLRHGLSELTLFLDTNFLFGILGLHYHSQVDVSNDLIRAIKKYNLPFKLRFHEATDQEMRATIDHYGTILRSRVWTQSLSRAGVKSHNLSGIEQKFHEKNSNQSVDVDEFLRPYEHFDQLLVKQNIKIFRPHENREQEKSDLFHEYKEFLENRGRSDKQYGTIMHDVTVLEETRRLRRDTKSSLEAGALIVTCDYYLYQFDQAYSRRNNHRACVLLPNIFWQILRPFIPADENFDKAFAETFALPEFRALGSGGSKACSKMVQVLASYKDVPEETAFKMLSNDILLNRLKSISDEQEFAEQIEAEFIQENKGLIEEKVALEQQLEKERKQREGQVKKHTEQLEEYQKGQTQLNDELEKVRSKLESAQKTQEQISQKHDLGHQAEKQAFRMSVIAGLAVGLLLVVGFELAIRLIPWEWMKNHPNTIPLQLGISLVLMLGSVGSFATKWRKWCWGIGVFGLVIAILGLLGGSNGSAT